MKHIKDLSFYEDEKKGVQVKIVKDCTKMKQYKYEAYVRFYKQDVQWYLTKVFMTKREAEDWIKKSF